MSRYWQQEEEVSTEIEEGRNYSKTELNAIADALLKEDARTELCRTCAENGEEFVGQPTGNKEQLSQDIEGKTIVLEFEELKCDKDHRWFTGEGKAKGIGGDNAILFEEHLQSRKRREIYTAVGTPDPEIVSGMYNRTHPQGRKVNSEDQRRKNGASFYR